MYNTYKDRAAFYAVYIQEAHPSDLWQMPSNVRENVVLASPRTDSEREGVATSCVRRLGIQFPAVVDRIENGVERSYTGWPDRLYLIGADGTVKYKSAPGPFGFEPKDLEDAFRRELGLAEARR